MKPTFKQTILAAALTLALTPGPGALGADSADQAALVKEKIQTLRSGCADGRNQITRTLEELNRMLVPGVELRPQLEKFKGELAKLEKQAATARDRATTMKEKGQAFFNDWEEQVRTIQNEDIRKEAAGRLEKRKKSYNKIISSMQDAREELAPFMGELKDIRTLLDSELTPQTVASAKGLIRKANWDGHDACDSLVDVEKELDRVSAELASYK
jgi:chromosome segregation ATPase